MSKLTKYCPKVGGPCIGERCVAYRKGMYTMINSESFKEAIPIVSSFQKPFPIQVELDVSYCEYFDEYIEGKDEVDKYLKELKPWNENQTNDFNDDDLEDSIN